MLLTLGVFCWPAHCEPSAAVKTSDLISLGVLEVFSVCECCMCVLCVYTHTRVH